MQLYCVKIQTGPQSFEILRIRAATDKLAQHIAAKRGMVVACWPVAEDDCQDALAYLERRDRLERSHEADPFPAVMGD